MNPELQISILNEAGRSVAPDPELWRSLQLVKLAEPAGDVSQLLQQPQEQAPDSVVVFLDGLAAMPAWLGDLIRRFPQTPVMVCADNQQMDFLLQALQLGVREVLPSPPSREDMEAALRRLRFSQGRFS